MTKKATANQGAAGRPSADPERVTAKQGVVITPPDPDPGPSNPPRSMGPKP